MPQDVETLRGRDIAEADLVGEVDRLISLPPEDVSQASFSGIDIFPFLEIEPDPVRHRVLTG
jgi:hypothetical protein